MVSHTSSNVSRPVSPREDAVEAQHMPRNTRTLAEIQPVQPPTGIHEEHQL